MATFLGVDVTKKAVYKDKDKVREKAPTKNQKSGQNHLKKSTVSEVFMFAEAFMM